MCSPDTHKAEPPPPPNVENTTNYYTELNKWTLPVPQAHTATYTQSFSGKLGSLGCFFCCCCFCLIQWNKQYLLSLFSEPILPSRCKVETDATFLEAGSSPDVSEFNGIHREMFSFCLFLFFVFVIHRGRDLKSISYNNLQYFIMSVMYSLTL